MTSGHLWSVKHFFFNDKNVCVRCSVGLRQTFSTVTLNNFEITTTALQISNDNRGVRKRDDKLLWRPSERFWINRKCISWCQCTVPIFDTKSQRTQNVTKYCCYPLVPANDMFLLPAPHKYKMKLSLNIKWILNSIKLKRCWISKLNLKICKCLI